MRGVKPVARCCEGFDMSRSKVIHVFEAERLDGLVRLYAASSGCEERWKIAQALCAIVDPKTQYRIDEIRRTIVAEAEARGAKQKPMNKVVIRTVKTTKPPDWTDVIITPEVDQTIFLDGTTLSKATAKELKLLLEVQRRAIRRLCKSVNVD